ncbi:MAG: hypothetical protein AAF366_14660 [Pseudomonadota bacterium]
MARKFTEWLHAKYRADYVRLRAYVTDADHRWDDVEALTDAWRLIDEDVNLAPVAREDMKKLVSLAFVEFKASEPRHRHSFMGLNAFGLGVFLFMTFILMILGVAIFEQIIFSWYAPELDTRDQLLLTRLADVEMARGLITFVFTIGVIALALIIVTANVTSNDGDSIRFERSKEILTSMIAILGTILGFYFGRADSSPAAMSQEAPIAPIPLNGSADAGSDGIPNPVEN